MRSTKLFGPFAIDLDDAGMTYSVVIETAPAVVFRAGDDASGDGIPPQPASCLGTPGLRWMYWTVSTNFPEVKVLKS
ncbi:hypothetical protein [Edaphobacter albus]|uniref:hypothetical protein n=1 Tax=Edaphobacter sp. 4G125 TaxID=2763071 RepID=UPI001645CC1C|nr:hypothetical protein [Edaphobacter sp. 4G125]QNI36490.1 hypothetical protein H7846_16255 [Edaphobacter sp. 4G125]